MAKKEFKKHNPNDKLVDNKPMEDQIELVTDQPEEDQQTVETSSEVIRITPAKIAPVEAEVPALKRERGRPRNAEKKEQVNVRIPVEVLDQVRPLLPVLYGGSLATYITRLIKKDLEENHEKYLDMLK